MVKKKTLNDLYIKKGLDLRSMKQYLRGIGVDVSHETIRKWLIGYDIPLRSRGGSRKCDHDAIRILSENNYKPGWISELFQISKSTVKRIIYGG